MLGSNIIYFYFLCRRIVSYLSVAHDEPFKKDDATFKDIHVVDQVKRRVRDEIIVERSTAKE